MKNRFVWVFLLIIVLASACNSGAGTSRGVIVVNSPANGTVRRVLAREGMKVVADFPIVEIAIQSEAPPVATQPSENPQTRAATNFESAQSEVEAARKEVVRAEVEVNRLTPLVASGAASQGELDGARAIFYQAQQRLQRGQSAVQNAQTSLVTARNQPNETAVQTAPVEKTVYAQTTTAGTLSVITVREGDKVASGQPLATIRAD